MLRYRIASLIIYLLIISGSTIAKAEQVFLDTIAYLPNSIHETSGLIFLNDKLITHNDSGNEPILYEVDTVSGVINRKVVVKNATNVDWEDICFDESYIYIGDIGNNSGSRTDLKIYRLLISDFFGNTNDTVLVDTIQFNYSDQIDFIPGENSTNYDAEALISMGDSLYIFTKNWNDFRTNVYALPKMPGIYPVSKVDSIDSQGLVTGGCYNTLSGSVLLCGYDLTSVFILELSQFSGAKFSSGIILKTNLQVLAQIEAVTSRDSSVYYLTCEQSFLSSSMLFRLKEDSRVGVNKYSISSVKVFPNPSSDFINIQSEQALEIDLYTISGHLIWSKQAGWINISDLTKGIFLLYIKTLDGELIGSQKIIVN